MIPRLFDWIDTDDKGRLAIIPHPQGGSALLEEVRYLKSRGVETLVSFLTDQEISRLDLAAEEGWCQTAGIEYLRFPIADHTAPKNDAETRTFLELLSKKLAEDRAVVLHCFAGIGRSGLTAIAILVLLGFDIDDACDRVSDARGLRVPETKEQMRWLRAFAEGLRSA